MTRMFWIEVVEDGEHIGWLDEEGYLRASKDQAHVFLSEEDWMGEVGFVLVDLPPDTQMEMRGFPSLFDLAPFTKP